MRNTTRQKYHDFFIALKDLAGQKEAAARTLVADMKINTNALIALKKAGIIKFNLQTGAMSWEFVAPIGENVENIYKVIEYYSANGYGYVQ